MVMIMGSYLYLTMKLVPFQSALHSFALFNSPCHSVPFTSMIYFYPRLNQCIIMSAMYPILVFIQFPSCLHLEKPLGSSSWPLFWLLCGQQHGIRWVQSCDFKHSCWWFGSLWAECGQACRCVLELAEAAKKGNFTGVLSPQHHFYVYIMLLICWLMYH